MISPRRLFQSKRDTSNLNRVDYINATNIKKNSVVGKKDWEIESNCNAYNQSTTTKRANSNLNNGKHIEYSWSHTACSNPIITAGATPTQNTSLSIKNILVLDIGYRRKYVIWVIHSFIISYAYFFSLHSPLFSSFLSFFLFLSFRLIDDNHH